MSQLKDLITQVDQAPSARDAIILCQDRWVKNYMITTGKKDGEARFQSELLNLLDIAADKPLMKRAPKFEYFKAMMVISRTGLSLAGNGHIYIEPYEEVDANKKPTGVVKIKVTVGNHGKREMLRSMKEIKDVSAGHVVMDGDEFQYDELNRQVIKHVKTPKSATDNSLEKLVGAYVRVEYADGHKVDVYMMKSEILRAKAKSKNKRDDGPWTEWPLEMAKKVVYHRAYKELYRAPEGLELTVGDIADGEEEETQNIAHTVVDEPPVDVDESTGEVLEPEVQQTKPKRETSKVKTEDVEPFA